MARVTYGSHPIMNGTVPYGGYPTYKRATRWLQNPSAEAERYKYNSLDIAYNSTEHNFSGVVDDDRALSEKTPADWSDVDT